MWRVQMELPAPLKVSMRARNSLQRDILDAHVPGLMDMMSLCSPVTARVARHPMSTNHESILGTFLRLGAIWFLDKVQWKWTCCYGEGHGLHPLIGKVIDWRAACCRPEKRKALSHWLLFLKCLVDSEGPKLMLQKDTSCLATTALIRKSNREF